MKQRIKKHFSYYLSFVALQAFGFCLVLLSAHDKSLQLSVIAGTTLVYIFWALMHQYIHHHVNPKIVVEYVLVGLLGIMFSFLMFSV